MAGLLAAMKGARFFFEVRDLWPESARVVGELKNPAVLRAATAFEEWCYARADKIVVVTEGIRSRLMERGIPASKIILAQNGANLGRFAKLNIAPIDPSPQPSPRRFEIFYGGLLGLAQGIPGLIQALHILKDEPSFHMTIAGAGPYGQALLEAKEKDGLTNVTLLGNVPAAQVPDLIAKADACLVPLGADPLFRGALPSKMFEAWACGRPVLLSAAGEAAKLVSRTRAGVIVPPDDPGALAEAILWMGKNRKTLAEMGELGKIAVQSFDRVAIAKNLLEQMEPTA
jgi:glycosyltransferase involved in cell wall biosynthesis